MYVISLSLMVHPVTSCSHVFKQKATLSKPGVPDQAVQTTGRHHKLNTHYFNLMLIMC